jgi:uncharacterized protein (DUF433 family)
MGTHVEGNVATVAYAQIEINEEGQAVIAETRIKVRMIALDRMAHGWDAEEIQRHHPDLTLGQIHSALAYDFDHQEEMDRDIAARHARVEEWRAAQGESPGRRKLREKGLLP